MDKVKDLDLYLLLGVDPDADDGTIKSAYRKKALKCHPDKNPDNPKAAELFHQLSDAYNVLSDEKARKAYDNVLKARKANELRNRQLDAKRKKLKDELEAREKAASEKRTEDFMAGENLKREIERLQKEGRRQLEEEQERLRQMIIEEEQNPTFEVFDQPQKLKLKWKKKADAAQQYDVETLKRIFCKYGDVGEVIVMENKKEKGKYSALIEMKSGQAARLAANIEKGFPDNPLKKVQVLDEKVQKSDIPSAAVPQPPPVSSQKVNFGDYETLVMRQLRQEEERKRLIEEMKRLDKEDEN